MSNEGSGKIKIFAGRTGEMFARRMCDYLGAELGKSTSIKFSEGNIFVRIDESVRDKDVYLVQPVGLEPNDELVELIFWIDAFKRASANSVTAIIPYFSYAKGDKKDEPRVSIRARVCADCLEAAGVDRVITMDLHAAQVEGFFSKPVEQLYARPLLCEYVRRAGIVDDDLVVVSPDAGFAKRARLVATELNRPVAIGDKTRFDHTENAKILEIIGDVKDKNCLITDDFSISGGTLVDIATGLKDKGAKRIFACLSHNVLSAAGAKKIENSPIEFVVSTDTVENPNIIGYSKIRTVSAAPLFAEAVRLIHEKEGVSNMFESNPQQIRHMLDKSLEAF